MNKLIFGLGAALLGLVLTGTANAHGLPPLPPPPGAVHGHRPVHARAYYLDHGTRYAGGYYYSGRDHHHWSYQVWNARYGRYQYWDPNLNCYYYYDTGRGCYYPVN